MVSQHIQPHETKDLGVAIQALIDDNLAQYHKVMMGSVESVYSSQTNNARAPMGAINTNIGGVEVTLFDVPIGSWGTHAFYSEGGLKNGDLGLLFVLDTSLENFYKGEGASNATFANTNKSDLSNSIFIPMVFNSYLPEPKASIQSDAELSLKGKTAIEIGTDTNTLGRSIDKLLNAIIKATTAQGVALNPSTIAELQQVQAEFKAFLK